LSKRYTDNEKQELIDQLFSMMVNKKEDDFTVLIRSHPFLVNINQNNEYYHPTPVSKSADIGLTGCVRELISARANLDCKSGKTWVTPLWRAAKKNNKKIVQMLVDARANVDIAGKWGSTPLMISSFKGHVECMVILITAEADVNLTDNRGLSALHHAIETKSTSPLKVLIEAGVNVDQQTIDGRTAYSSAGSDTLRLLLQETVSPYKLALKKTLVELMHNLLPKFPWDVLQLVMNYAENDGANPYIASSECSSLNKNLEDM